MDFHTNRACVAFLFRGCMQIHSALQPPEHSLATQQHPATSSPAPHYSSLSFALPTRYLQRLALLLRRTRNLAREVWRRSMVHPPPASQHTFQSRSAYGSVSQLTLLTTYLDNILNFLTPPPGRAIATDDAGCDCLLQDVLGTVRVARCG